MQLTRRAALSNFALAGFVAVLPRAAKAQGSRASSSLDPYGDMRWGSGFEGQRKADLGDGTYLNPILAGDRPDPSLLRDGGDYYVTFSTFDAYPGLTIWHSRDLVNWRPSPSIPVPTEARAGRSSTSRWRFWATTTTSPMISSVSAPASMRRDREKRVSATSPTRR
jgi:hypothetical protein